MKHSASPQHTHENGNVFLFVLLGIALFAALAFTVSRSMESSTATKMSSRQSKIFASDIITSAQKIERAVARIRRKSTSENDISFDNPIVSGYAHGQPNANKVFNTAGGNAKWQTPQPNVNDGSQWLITGSTCIVDLGTGASGCNSDTTSNEELLLVLPNLNESVCSEINKSLGISTIPTDTGGGHSTTKFIGTLADDTEIDTGTPYRTICYQRSSTYHFYHALLVR